MLSSYQQQTTEVTTVQTRNEQNPAEYKNKAKLTCNRDFWAFNTYPSHREKLYSIYTLHNNNNNRLLRQKQHKYTHDKHRNKLKSTTKTLHKIQ